MQSQTDQRALRVQTTLSLFEDHDLQRMAKEARRLAAEIPFRIQGTDEFFDLIAAAGCRIEGETVTFPGTAIDRVFDRMSEQKTKRLRSAQKTARAETHEPLRLQTHGQAYHICDAETNRLRPATVEDLAAWCRMVDALGIDRRSHPTFIPTDVPRRSASFHAFATIALSSLGTHRVSVYAASMLPYFIEASNIAAPGVPPAFATKCWVNSPFMITRENIRIAMDARRLLGRPVQFGVMPVAGASTPVTVAGALTQNTAESIALSAMRLATDNLLHPLEPTASILDMGAATHRQSGPDLFLHSVAASDMRRHLTGDSSPPHHHTGVASPVVSHQSLYEKALAASKAVSLGARTLGVGCLAFSDVGSPVQLILDVAMGKELGAMLRPVDADDDHIGADAIAAVAPTGAGYLESEHTATHFREELWLQSLVDFRAPLAWVQDPRGMVDEARQSAIELLATAENRSPLGEKKRRDIEALITEADRVALTQEDTHD